MNNGGYQPYMFGGSYGAGSSNNGGLNPNGYAGQNTRRDGYNVRDCMYWPASLGGSQPQSSNRGSYGGASFDGSSQQAQSMPMPMQGGFFNQASMVGGSGSNQPYVFHAGYTNDDYGTGEPMQLPPQAPVKAYMSTPGDGGANGKPIQIPCHMGSGPGQLPPVPSMSPLGYKVTVPQVAPTAPLDFEIKQ